MGSVNTVRRQRRKMGWFVKLLWRLSGEPELPEEPEEPRPEEAARRVLDEELASKAMTLSAFDDIRSPVSKLLAIRDETRARMRDVFESVLDEPGSPVGKESFCWVCGAPLDLSNTGYCCSEKCYKRYAEAHSGKDLAGEAEVVQARDCGSRPSGFEPRRR